MASTTREKAWAVLVTVVIAAMMAVEAFASIKTSEARKNVAIAAAIPATQNVSDFRMVTTPEEKILSCVLKGESAEKWARNFEKYLEEEKARRIAKEDAKAAVEALTSDSESDEVKTIVEKAITDIEGAADIDAVEAIADAAEKAVAEQKAAEKKAAEEAARKAAEEAKKRAASTAGSAALYSASYFANMGRIRWNGWDYTWYSSRVLPGEGLRIPGRHTDENGYIRDGDGYLCLASDAHSKGTVLPTPFGSSGKVYDCGCGNTYTLDVYVSW